MFNKVKELLESDSISKEAAEAIDSEISLALGTLRTENKTLREDKDTMSKNYDAVVKSKSDLDEQLNGLDEKIAQARKDGLSESVTALEAEKAKHKTLQDSLSNLEKSNTQLKLDNAVARELDKFDIKKDDKELVGFKLRAGVSLNDESNVVYNDGSTAYTLEDGFKSYFEANSSRLNAQGNSDGSGARGNGSGSANSLDRVAFEKLDAGSRAKFMADGGKLI